MKIDKFGNNKISIIVPTYKADNCLFELYTRIKNTFEKIDFEFELIFINDFSPQEDWAIVCSLAVVDNRVKGLSFSRNFGQHYAITAGLEASTGEWIVVMDCDLQDQPEEIINLINKTKEGYQIVLAQRIRRKDIYIKKIFSKIFYAFLGYLTDTKQDASIGNFGIYHRKVISSILQMSDSTRYFPTMVKWVGFKTTSLEVQHSERLYGKTSYNFKKLFYLALDVILAFSYKPLKLVIKFGIYISFLSILFGFFIMYRFFNHEINVPGWASIMVSIWFFSGLIIFFIGVVGLYVGRIFDNVKNRPLYIIDESINLD